MIPQNTPLYLVTELDTPPGVEMETLLVVGWEDTGEGTYLPVVVTLHEDTLPAIGQAAFVFKGASSATSITYSTTLPRAVGRVRWVN